MIFRKSSKNRKAVNTERDGRSHKFFSIKSLPTHFSILKSFEKSWNFFFVTIFVRYTGVALV